MDLSAGQLVAIGFALFGGSLVNSTIGFASAVFALPVMLMAGVSLPSAITLNLVGATVQTGVGSFKLRSEIDFATLARPVAIRLLTLPVGIALLVYTHRAVDSHVVRQVVGIVLLSVLAVQWFWRVEPRSRLHPGWELLAFSCSGIMMGFLGMGGPPMVLWVMAHRWPAARSRAFMFAIIASGLIPQAVLLLAMFGQQFVQAALVGLASIPVVLAGTLIGLRLGDRLRRQNLRRMAFGILAAMAIAAAVSPLLSRRTPQSTSSDALGPPRERPNSGVAATFCRRTGAGCYNYETPDSAFAAVPHGRVATPLVSRARLF